MVVFSMLDPSRTTFYAAIRILDCSIEDFPQCWIEFIEFFIVLQLAIVFALVTSTMSVLVSASCPWRRSSFLLGIMVFALQVSTSQNRRVLAPTSLLCPTTNNVFLFTVLEEEGFNAQRTFFQKVQNTPSAIRR